jgi:hypothetical protein
VIAFDETNGLLTADGGARLERAYEMAMARGWHLGSLSMYHSTVGQAAAAGDPVLCHRAVRLVGRNAHGVLAGPLAPRAAVGPDLGCFVVGTHTPPEEVTLRADQAVSWGAMADEGFLVAMDTARTLAYRGCTLVELHAESRGERVSIQAAFPRPSLAALLPSCVAPTPKARKENLSWVLPWGDAPRVWQALAADSRVQGTLQLSALDASLCVLRVVRTHPQQAPDGLLAQALLDEILGAVPPLPSYLPLAFALNTGPGGNRV